MTTQLNSITLCAQRCVHSLRINTFLTLSRRAARRQHRGRRTNGSSQCARARLRRDCVQPRAVFIPPLRAVRQVCECRTQMWGDEQHRHTHTQSAAGDRVFSFMMKFRIKLSFVLCKSWRSAHIRVLCFVFGFRADGERVSGDAEDYCADDDNVVDGKTRHCSVNGFGARTDCARCSLMI